MKKYKISRFSKGDRVILTNGFKGFVAGQIVIVDDPIKYGSEHKIKVHDARGKCGMIPSKYLKVVV